MRFDFYDFSRFRAQLMGVSILLIMLFHISAVPFGYVGVEFFLLISAIGLYFSLSKDNHLKSFYKKRLIRILPAYLIIAIPYFIYIRRTNFNIGEFFYLLSGLGISQERSFWFIIQILICYLIAPFYFKVLDYKYSIIIPFITLLAFFCLGLYFPAEEIMLNRFAIFLLGLHFAKFVYNKNSIQSPFIIPLGIIAIFLIAVVESLDIYIGLKRVIFFFLTIPALMLLIIIIKRCPKYINQSLVFLGGITLEIYMLHDNICVNLLEKYCGVILGATLSFPVCIFLAYYYHKFINIITDRLSLR